MKKGFTVIEILISMMVLFVAIGFVNISIKAFNNYQRKSEVYQNFYVTTLSLKDWVLSQPLDETFYQGKMNGLTYKIDVKELISRKNYRYSFDTVGGNSGDFLITLYQIKLELKNRNRKKDYIFFSTRQKRIIPLTELEEVEY
jgi:Tfp pilus assembly protein PilE